jgi:mRNA interferase MazF
MDVRRGEVFYADLSPVVGSEQGGIRPVLIIQNNIGNRHSPTVIAAAITSRQDKNRLPTHIGVRADRCGLSRDSIVLTEQIRTLDKRRLREKAGCIPPEDMQRVDEALGISMGLLPQDTHIDGGYF